MMSTCDKVPSHSVIPGNLILYFHPLGSYPSNMLEHAEALQQHSVFPTWRVNVALGFPSRLGNLQFQIITFHYSLFTHEYYPLSDRWLEYLRKQTTAFKIAFCQDEHNKARKRDRFLAEQGVQMVFSCLKPIHFPEVYPQTAKKAICHTTIPGYVSDKLLAMADKFRLPLADRTIDVGYRARPIPIVWGKGALEKVDIASGFLEHAKAADGLDLRLDISTAEEDRLYGDEWWRFVASCRTMLGVESGVSVFDLDGDLYPRLSYAKTYGDIAAELALLEERFEYRTISPRHFESIAFRVAQVLFEGDYSGALKPDIHYISMKKDFSNIREVLDKIKDEALLTRISDRAYQDIITSGNYSYKEFIRIFDDILSEQIGSPALMSESERLAVAECVQANDFVSRLRQYFLERFYRPPYKEYIQMAWRIYNALKGG